MMRTTTSSLRGLLLHQVLVLLVLAGPVLTDDRPSWFWLFLVSVVVWELLLVRDLVRWWRSRAEQEPSRE